MMEVRRINSYLLMRFVVSAFILLHLSLSVFPALIDKSGEPNTLGITSVDFTKNPLPKTSSPKFFCVGVKSNCSKVGKPVCAYTFPTLSQANYSSLCQACNKSVELAFALEGFCSTPKPPIFKPCKSYSPMITKCELVSQLIDTPYCVINQKGQAKTISQVSSCTNLCREPDALKYVNADCDFIHDGKKVRQWGRLTTNVNKVINLPKITLKVGYTRCQTRLNECNKSLPLSRVCGIKGPEVQRQYNNSCLACLDQQVKGWSDGQCGESIYPPSYIICPNIDAVTDATQIVADPSAAPCVPDTGICVMDRSANFIQEGMCIGEPCSNKSILIYVKAECSEVYSELTVWWWTKYYSRLAV